MTVYVERQSQNKSFAIGAVLSANNPQGYANNVADGLFAIAAALNRIASRLESYSASSNQSRPIQ